MSDKYLLGIDNGGTLIKAALFTLEGKEAGIASRTTEIITPYSGWTERDMELLFEQNCACIRQVMADAGIKPEAIAGAAVCGHGKGLYPWGRDGKPAYHGIISTDNRAWKYPEKWKNNGTHASLYDRLCQQFMACQQASLLAWFKDNERRVYDNIQWAFSVTDYIRFRLTGEAFSEATNISGSGLMNVRDARIDADLLEALGIGEVFDKIPPVRYSSEYCGTITKEAAEKTGLKEGTPVAGGMFDIDSCAIAMSVTRPEDFCTITGTWTINEFIAKTPVTGTAIAMNSLYAIPGFFLIEESSSTGAGNLEWLINNCFQNETPPGGKKLYAHLDDMAASVPAGDCDVYFLPFLQGSNCHPLAKASFIGLTSFHTRAHLLRSVYEGVVFSAKTHIDKLLSVRENPQAVRMAGGAANSRFWVQMFADILELPIETVTGVKELGALGCAMAAAVAAGIYRDYNEAAQAMVRISPPVYPNPKASSVYRSKYEKYTAVCNALDTVWNRFEV
ncbi:MAG: carbohydrate kinase [Spirochaetaceae bacterium]|jgi:L-xylulokinase|nr:carbohydrate kinase [Spirochaetaceae bacterium]